MVTTSNVTEVIPSPHPTLTERLAIESRRKLDSIRTDRPRAQHPSWLGQRSTGNEERVEGATTPGKRRGGVWRVDLLRSTAPFRGVHGKLDAAAGMELIHDPADVVFNRAFCQKNFSGNLFVTFAFS